MASAPTDIASASLDTLARIAPLRLPSSRQTIIVYTSTELTLSIVNAATMWQMSIAMNFPSVDRFVALAMGIAPFQSGAIAVQVAARFAPSLSTFLNAHHKPVEGMERQRSLAENPETSSPTRYITPSDQKERGKHLQQRASASSVVFQAKVTSLNAAPPMPVAGWAGANLTFGREAHCGQCIMHVTVAAQATMPLIPKLDKRFQRVRNTEDMVAAQRGLVKCISSPPPCSISSAPSGHLYRVAVHLAPPSHCHGPLLYMRG
eukprot:4277823-Amphidinium_carterae.1